jgi:hypothetical protein
MPRDGKIRKGNNSVNCLQGNERIGSCEQALSVRIASNFSVLYIFRSWNPI